MDNRLGERLPIHRTIRLVSSRPRSMSIGLLKNLSRSGALIANCELQLFSLIQVYLEFAQQPKIEATVGAYVTRIGEDGAGVEWCEYAPTAVTELLQMENAALVSCPENSPAAAEPELSAALAQIA